MFVLFCPNNIASGIRWRNEKKILKKKLKSVEKSTLNLIDEYHHHGYVLNHGVVMLA